MASIPNKIFADLAYLGSADRYVQDVTGVIEHINLFDDFNEAEITALAHYMVCYSAPKDYKLLNEGDSGDYLLLLLSGGAVVQKRIEDLGSHNIAEIGVGSILGEMSLLDGHQRFASCVTTMPTNFAVLTRASLNEIMVYSPRLGNKFLLIILQMMADRIRASCDRFLPAVYGSIV
jgi:CRP-like cAMP-binding protein